MNFRWIRFAEVSKIFEYDETSPSCLRWKITVYSGRGYAKVNVAEGDIAGSESEGYFRVVFDSRKYLAHRIVYALCTGMDVGPTDVVDHIDGIPANNYISNLRLTSFRLNTQNRAMPSTNTSGKTGVHWSSNGAGNEYAIATWYDADRKLKKKRFSVTKLGRGRAWEEACIFRDKMIQVQGTYTDRHGTKVIAVADQNKEF